MGIISYQQAIQKLKVTYGCNNNSLYSRLQLATSQMNIYATEIEISSKHVITGNGQDVHDWIAGLIFDK